MNDRKSQYASPKFANTSPSEQYQFAYGFYLPKENLPILYKIVYGRDSSNSNLPFLISQIRRKLPDAFPWIKLLDIRGKLFCGGEVPSTNFATNRKKIGEMKCDYFEIQIKAILDFVTGLTSESYRVKIERVQ